jgi:hypothetical protein
MAGERGLVVRAKEGEGMSDKTECIGSDDPEERCPRHPDECTCWQVDLNKSQALKVSAQKAGNRGGAGFVISVYSDGVFIREEALDGPSDVIFIKSKHLGNLIASLQEILNANSEVQSW